MIFKESRVFVLQGLSDATFLINLRHSYNHIGPLEAHDFSSVKGAEIEGALVHISEIDNLVIVINACEMTK